MILKRIGPVTNADLWVMELLDDEGEVVFYTHEAPYTCEHMQHLREIWESGNPADQHLVTSFVSGMTGESLENTTNLVAVFQPSGDVLKILQLPHEKT